MNETKEIRVQCGYNEFVPVSVDWDPEYQIGAMEDNGAAWDRETYERVCGDAGVKSMTDAEIEDVAYALRFAEYTMDTWRGTMTRDQRVGYLLASHRLRGHRVEAADAAPGRAVEMVTCNCGHVVSRSQVMNASMGSSCPDCYDRMS